MGDLVGLSGWARSGKDTVGGFLIDHGYVRFGFADALKNVLYDTNPIVVADTGKTYQLKETVDTQGWEWAKDHTNARLYMQRLGTAVRDYVDPDAWLNAVLRWVDDEDKVVVTDVRYRNEANAIRAKGGRIIRINRSFCLPANDHASEREMDDYPFDLVIQNNGRSLALLRLLVDAVAVD